MNKTIFFVSPQHTGTWFTIRMFLEHADVATFIQLCFVRPFLLDGRPKGRRKEFIHKTEITLIHSHVKHWGGADKVELGQAIFFAMMVLPTVCSVRDPLLALITRLERHPKLESSDIVDGFITLFQDVEALKDINPPILLSIDARNSLEERHRKVRDVLTHVGLAPEPLATTWACKWPSLEDLDTNADLRRLYNGRSMYPTKQAYLNGDAKYLKTHMGPYWGALRAKESILRPPLEALGYSNLMWWS